IPGESANRQSTKRLHSWLNRAVFPRQAPFAWGAGILFGGKLPQYSLRPAKLWLFTGTAQTDLFVDLPRPWLQRAELRDLQRCQRRFTAHSRRRRYHDKQYGDAQSGLGPARQSVFDPQRRTHFDYALRGWRSAWRARARLRAPRGSD